MCVPGWRIATKEIKMEKRREREIAGNYSEVYVVKGGRYNKFQATKRCVFVLIEKPTLYRNRQ